MLCVWRPGGAASGRPGRWRCGAISGSRCTRRPVTPGPGCTWSCPLATCPPPAARWPQRRARWPPWGHDERAAEPSWCRPSSRAGDPMTQDGGARRPNVGRVYNCLLGGKDNYEQDRQAARELVAVVPEARAAARANRRFVGRAVRFLAGDAGIGQFPDIGAGLPALGTVGQVALGLDPLARVAYADNDPVAVSHARAFLCTAPGVCGQQRAASGPGPPGHPGGRRPARRRAAGRRAGSRSGDLVRVAGLQPRQHARARSPRHDRRAGQAWPAPWPRPGSPARRSPWWRRRLLEVSGPAGRAMPARWPRGRSTPRCWPRARPRGDPRLQAAAGRPRAAAPARTSRHHNDPAAAGRRVAGRGQGQGRHRPAPDRAGRPGAFCAATASVA